MGLIALTGTSHVWIADMKDV